MTQPGRQDPLPGFGVFNDDPERRGAWIQSFTGRKIWPLDPRPEDFCIEDIAHGLSMVCRYGGHTKRFYSVAEHCVLVALYVAPEHRREALLHDSSEAFIGDMVRPLKHQPEMIEFRNAEAAIERAIRARFGIISTLESHAAIKAIDDRIIIDEVGALMSRPPDYWTRHPDVKALDTVILGLPPSTAEQVFLDTFRNLFPEFAT